MKEALAPAQSQLQRPDGEPRRAEPGDSLASVSEPPLSGAVDLAPPGRVGGGERHAGCCNRGPTERFGALRQSWQERVQLLAAPEVDVEMGSHRGRVCCPAGWRHNDAAGSPHLGELAAELVDHVLVDLAGPGLALDHEPVAGEAVGFLSHDVKLVPAPDSPVR